jgi:hypothetical protein
MSHQIVIAETAAEIDKLTEKFVGRNGQDDI